MAGAKINSYSLGLELCPKYRLTMVVFSNRERTGDPEQIHLNFSGYSSRIFAIKSTIDRVFTLVLSFPSSTMKPEWSG